MTALDTLQPERPQALAQLMGDGGADDRGTSLWRGAFQRLRRNPSAVVGAVIVALFVLVAVFVILAIIGRIAGFL